MNYVTEYYRQIEAGEIVVSAKVRKVYRKLVQDIEKPGKYIFDEKKANRPIEFIERFCRHSKGEWSGKPIRLELFQKAYINALFGFVDRETGLRQYRESLFIVARKNGKSTMLAGLALYMLLADHEAGAEVYSCATKRDQAMLIFDEIYNMVKQSKEFRRLIRKRKSDLYCESTMGKIMALGKNYNSLDGLNSSCVIMDELHAVKNRELYEVLKQSQSARRQPLMIAITTAGTVRECIFDDMYSYAKSVLDGTFQDETFLPVIYELDNRKEWEFPKCWQKANPGLGTIKKLGDLQAKVNRAKNSPVDLKGILCKDFNIRENSVTAWLSFEDINNEKTFELSRFYGKYAIGGADLSITTDLTAATLLMLDPETEERFIHQMYWIPEENLEKRVKEDKIPYDVWVSRGLVRLCKGNTINYSDVTAWYVEMVMNMNISPAWIYYDSYSARYWVEEMESKGFTMVRCIQGAKTLSLPMQQLGADLQAKRINYNNNPVLKWCLTNTGVVTDRNGNILPIKDRNPKRRIDGTASLLDAYVGLTDHYNEFKDAQ